MAISQKQSNLAIGELAKSLANNYAYSHVFGSGKEKKSLRKSLLKEGSLIKKYSKRVIVIVGSGASQDAKLLGTEAAFLEIKKDNFPLPEKVIDAELTWLESVQKLNKEQFETRLLAMSSTEYSGKIVRERLVEIYNRRFLPTLSYEILAHLLKHKFVDAIISFNFDELLDQAISDELNPEEYFRILSDGDCPSDPLHSDKALKKPFYIKPHGTISHQSTLRFTRDDYYRLPQGIQELIKNLLSGRPVDLISIGFDMKSFEFISIVNKARENKLESNIFYINKKEVVSEPELIGFEKPQWIEVTARKNKLGVVLQNILDQTHEHLNKQYPPRSIDRHQTLALLFEGEKKKKKDNRYYLWDRTVIELALAVAKAKGFITMSVLSSGRPGKYFKEYKSMVPTHKEPFRKLCEDIGLTDIAYGFDALRLSKKPIPKILSKNEFNGKLKSFLIKVREQLKPLRKGTFDKHKVPFKETLLMHYKGAEVELRSPPEIVHDNLFLNPKPITSKRALDCQTTSMLGENDWNYVLLVSETGEWLDQDTLKNALNSDTNRKIYVVVADDSHQTKLEKRYPNQIRIVSMNWWDHNRHLTLFLHKDPDKDPKVLRSIYFTRSRRATDIVPVLLDSKDSEIIFEFWKAYWLRATEGKTITRKRIREFKFPPNLDGGTDR
jgi:hypothetical protein